jgi:hypothetical protein
VNYYVNIKHHFYFTPGTQLRERVTEPADYKNSFHGNIFTRYLDCFDKIEIVCFTLRSWSSRFCSLICSLCSVNSVCISPILCCCCWTRFRNSLTQLNTTFNNISVTLWQSVILVEETRVPWENHRPAASHWQTLVYHIMLYHVHLAWAEFELTTLVVIGTDCKIIA